MSKAVANIGSVVAVLLAILWTVACFSPWVWISSSSNAITFKASLLCLWTSPGVATGVVSGVAGLVGLSSVSRKMDGLVNRDLWLEKATTQYCDTGYETIFKWCGNWMMVKYSSWGMLFFAVSTVATLLLGACFTAYYANFHATETGRTWIKVSFISAPLCAIAGLSQYIALTLDFGQMRNAGPVTSIYGTGFLFSCVLCVLSWIPLCLHALLSRKARNEKAQSNDSSGSDEDGVGMGWANAAPGYSTFGAPPGSNPGMLGPGGQMLAGPAGGPAMGGQFPGPVMSGPPVGGPGMGGHPYGDPGFGGAPLGGPGMGSQPMSGPGMGGPPMGTPGMGGMPMSGPGPAPW